MSKLVRRGRPARHGGFSYLITGELPEKRQYLMSYLTEIREGLIHDTAGSEENLTTGQKILIDRVITKVGVLRLIEEHVRDKGIFRGEDIVPALGNTYIAFDNSVRLTLQLLGVERRPDERALPPLEYMRRQEKGNDNEKIILPERS